MILAGYAGQAPERIGIYLSEVGKPSIEGAGVYFNVSHSDARATIAVRAGGEVGVDIQTTRAVTDDLAIARAAFAPDEIAYLEKLAGQERSMLFFRLWACREAVLKTAGVGITEQAGKLVLRTNPQGALTVAASPRSGARSGSTSSRRRRSAWARSPGKLREPPLRFATSKLKVANL